MPRHLITRFAPLFVTILAVAGFFAFHGTVFAAGEGTDCGGNIICQITNGGGDWVARVIAAGLLVIVQGFNVLLGYVGMFFNWVMLVTVFRFSDYMGNSTGMLLAWGILRDLANIALLFGFIFIGVQTILQVEKHDVKKALPRLLIFAAALNFSLFAAEAAVDISNALGSAIYEQATSTNCRDAANIVECQDQGLAAAIFQTSGISSLLGPDSDVSSVFDSMEGQGVRAIVLAMCILIFVIVMMFVLGAGALMLVSRAITLMLLLVTSPIGFAGFAIPALNKFSKDWYEKLVQNVAFAPVFVLLVLIGLKIVSGLKASLIGNASMLALLSSPSMDVGGIILLFAIVIGFMIAALKSASHYSLMGSKQVVGAAMKGIGNTVGEFTVYPFNRMAGGLNKAYNFGVRSTPAPIRALLGVPFGGVDRGIRSGLKSLNTAVIPHTGMDNLTQKEKNSKDRKYEIAKTNTTNDKSRSNNQELAGDFKEARKGNTDKLETSLRKMSTPDLKAAIKGLDKKDLEVAAVAMSASKFKAVLDGDDIDGSTKKVLRDARYAPLKEYLRTENGSEIRKMHVDDLVASGLLDNPSTRATLMNHISDQQFDALTSHPDFGGNAVQEFKNLRNGTAKGGRFADIATATKTINNMSPAKVAKLPGSTLTYVRKALKPEHFAAIVTNDELTGSDKAEMVKHVKSVYARAPGDPERDALWLYLSNIGRSGSLRSKFRSYYGI